TLIRAFSVYFDLINLAEQRARLRALHQRALDTGNVTSEGIEAAIRELRERQVSAAQIDELLRRASVMPVFTAHPSEARRRTILEKLKAISKQLDAMEYGRLSPREH